MEVLFGKNTAHDYTLEAVYESYIQNRIDNENRINQLISECTILNEANTGIVTKTRKISALYEASMGDTIKAKFNKFIEFLKNIWGKFMANMTKALADEQTYLKKYADIIQNKKGRSDIKVSYYGNYDKGIQRINQVIVPPFDWNTMHEALSDEENAFGKFFASHKITGMQGFDYDENTELAPQLKDFFIGGEDGQTDTTMNNMDLKTMYNFCWNFKKIQDITQKDIKNMESSANKIQQTVQQRADAVVKADTNQSGSTEKAEPVVAQHNSAIDMALLKYLTEGPNDQSDSSSGDSEHAPGQTKLNTTSVNISKGSGSFDRQDDKTKEANANSQADDIEAGKDANTDNNDYLNNVNKVIDNYISICRAVITAKWTAAEQIIAKDYMKIINMHVKSFIGKDVEKDNKNAKAKQYDTDESKGIKNSQSKVTNNK